MSVTDWGLVDIAALTSRKESRASLFTSSSMGVLGESWIVPFGVVANSGCEIIAAREGALLLPPTVAKTPVCMIGTSYVCWEKTSAILKLVVFVGGFAEKVGIASDPVNG